ncbi:MAG TPA: BON domain-containing protein [Thermoanaerobaculia bacterium]|jgi:osmotically-inducible protein OsmY|nr:BON domain-containing protein [Thermoanaerobaculia bacterium]
MHSHGKIFYVPALCLAVLSQAILPTLPTLAVTASAAVLGVLSGCQTAEAARLQPDAGRDAKITSTIQAKLAALASEDKVNPFKIAVTSHDGVVTLKGRVSNVDAREKAERYARETDGVQRVIDLVKVGDRQ